MTITGNFLESLDEFAQRVNANAILHGFWDHNPEPSEKIALMHSEVSELLEAVRKPGESEHIPAFTGQEEECADIIMRVLDYAYKNKLHIGAALLAKHEFNVGRAHKHRKAF